MQFIDNQSVFETVDHRSEFSSRWLIRRFALWVLLMALGITGSCLLYNVAGTAEADAPAQTAKLVNP